MAGDMMKRCMRLAAPAVLAMLIAPAGVAYASKEVARGERIFNGRETVPARLDGHDRALPAQLGKCIACHGTTPRSGIEAGVAPPLTGDALTSARSRRGGKPFAYDRQTFCSTLRTGMDPQYVIMLRTMPRFEVSEEQCRALWSYLTEQRHDRQR